MKKSEYQKPVAEAVQFSNEDVIATSDYSFLSECWFAKIGTDGPAKDATDDTRVGIRCDLTPNGNDVIIDNQGWMITTWGCFAWNNKWKV